MLLQLLCFTKDKRRRKGTENRTCLMQSAMHCCGSSLSFAHSSGFTAHTNESHCHPWYTCVRNCELFHSPRNDSRLPPSLPQGAVTQGERRKGQNIIQWYSGIMMSSLAFSALRRQQALCATELLLIWSFIMHNAGLSHQGNCSVELNGVKWHSWLSQHGLQPLCLILYLYTVRWDFV